MADSNIRTFVRSLGGTNPREHLSLEEMVSLRDRLTKDIRDAALDRARELDLKGPFGHIWHYQMLNHHTMWALCGWQAQLNPRKTSDRHIKPVRCVGCVLKAMRENRL